MNFLKNPFLYFCVPVLSFIVTLSKPHLSTSPAHSEDKYIISEQNESYQNKWYGEGTIKDSRIFNKKMKSVTSSHGKDAHIHMCARARAHTHTRTLHLQKECSLRCRFHHRREKRLKRPISASAVLPASNKSPLLSLQTPQAPQEKVEPKTSIHP